MMHSQELIEGRGRLICNFSTMSDSEDLYNYTTNINNLIQNSPFLKKYVDFGVNNKSTCIYLLILGILFNCGPWVNE